MTTKIGLHWVAEGLRTVGLLRRMCAVDKYTIFWYSALMVCG